MPGPDRRLLDSRKIDGAFTPPEQFFTTQHYGHPVVDPATFQLQVTGLVDRPLTLSLDDLRKMTPAVFAQLDRLDRLVDKIYVHIDMDVLDPREVMAHGNKVPNGPSSEELARLFQAIFTRYSKASAIGFATIPPRDSGGLSIAALNRMIEGAVRGVQAREKR